MPVLLPTIALLPMRLVPVILILVFASTAPAYALDISLVPRTHEIAAGETFEVDLLVTNSGDEATTYAPPSQLDLIIATADGDRTVSLQRAVGEVDATIVPAGGFLRVSYRGQMPSDLIGALTLDPNNVDANLVAIRSLSNEPGAYDIARFTSAISPYEPMYFLIGSRGNTTAKFQVSLKFRIFNPDTQTPFLEKLYLAYSQTSIWDLDTTSKPFHDASYRPSMFFLDDRISQWPFAKSRLGFQGGVEHESNGKDADVSRSFNIIFVRPALTFPLSADYALTFSPKIYQYFSKSENADIDEYRGNVDFLIRFGKENGWQLDTILRQGRTSGRGSVQVDLSYPLRNPLFGNLSGYLNMQYFNGYGESLVDYNVKLRSQFRIGLMVTRGLRW